MRKRILKLYDNEVFNSKRKHDKIIIMKKLIHSLCSMTRRPTTNTTNIRGLTKRSGKALGQDFGGTLSILLYLFCSI